MAINFCPALCIMKFINTQLIAGQSVEFNFDEKLEDRQMDSSDMRIGSTGSIGRSLEGEGTNYG